MEKNKTGKYLKYAIGEILLVVIGILIALSINNWNQKKQLSNKELPSPKIAIILTSALIPIEFFTLKFVFPTSPDALIEIKVEYLLLPTPKE